MYTVTVFLRVSPKTREEILQTIQLLCEELRDTPGFKKCEIVQDIDDANSFNFVEEWMTQRDMNAYLESQRFQVLLGALRVLSEEAEIRYPIDNGTGNVRRIQYHVTQAGAKRPR